MRPHGPLGLWREAPWPPDGPVARPHSHGGKTTSGSLASSRSAATSGQLLPQPLYFSILAVQLGFGRLVQAGDVPLEGHVLHRGNLGLRAWTAVAAFCHEWIGRLRNTHPVVIPCIPRLTSFSTVWICDSSRPQWAVFFLSCSVTCQEGQAPVRSSKGRSHRSAGRRTRAGRAAAALMLGEQAHLLVRFLWLKRVFRAQITIQIKVLRHDGRSHTLKQRTFSPVGSWLATRVPHYSGHQEGTLALQTRSCRTAILSKQRALWILWIPNRATVPRSRCRFCLRKLSEVHSGCWTIDGGCECQPAAAALDTRSVLVACVAHGMCGTGSGLHLHVVNINMTVFMSDMSQRACQWTAFPAFANKELI